MLSSLDSAQRRASARAFAAILERACTRPLLAFEFGAIDRFQFQKRPGSTPSSLSPQPIDSVRREGGEYQEQSRPSTAVEAISFLRFSSGRPSKTEDTGRAKAMPIALARFTVAQVLPAFTSPSGWR